MTELSNKKSTYFRLGLVINPFAGIGGPAGLKGSDHEAAFRLSRERGVQPKAAERVREMLFALTENVSNIHIVTASSAMGENACEGFSFASLNVVYDTPATTSSKDTQAAAKLILNSQVDLLVFVGGDGTARDIYRAIGSEQTVLGLPAGVKMHSAVFAVTPKAVASVIESMMSHRLVAARAAEVRDIDEQAFANGQVKTRYFGEMQIPDDQLLVQAVKCSGLLDDQIMLDELCAFFTEIIEDDTLYILGSGGTLKHLKESLGMDKPTLLGVDIWFQGEVIQKDAYEEQIFNLVQQHDKVKIVLSVIGGQGIVLGRGNQQISPRIIQKVGTGAIQFISTQSKLLALNGRALSVDSGCDELNKRLAGFHKIICGYEDFVLYEIVYS